MAQLRFRLTNNNEGSLVITKYDPIGINSLAKTIKRSKENDGVIFEITLDISFIKKGRRFIKRVFENEGVDGMIFVDIYEYNPNLRKWEYYYTGSVNLQTYRLREDRVTVVIEQSGFERSVLNLLESDIDLETTISENGSTIPATPTLEMEYHSKSILKEYNGTPLNNNEFQQLDALVMNFGPCEIGPCDRPRDETVYGQFDTTNNKFKELTESFSYPWGFSPTERFEVYRATETAVSEIHVRQRLKLAIIATKPEGDDIDVCGDGLLGNRVVKLYVERRDVDDNVLELTEFGEMATVTGCGGDDVYGDFEEFQYDAANVNFNIGDKLYVYFTVRISGTYVLAGGGPTGGPFQISHEFRVEGDADYSYIQVVGKTTAPASTAKTILYYEAVNKCCQYITNQEDCFRSDLLGRLDTVVPYAEDGKASLIGITNGNNMRGRPKQIFSNLQKLLDYVNSQFCTGFGFETINGKQVLRLEKKSYFWRKDQPPILRLVKVADPEVSVARDYQFSQFRYGYAGKLDIGQVNAIDEYNSERAAKVPTRNTKNQLDIRTDMRGAGYQIEYQRRLVTSTEDGKLDDENFVISVIRDGGTFRTRKNEGYVSVTNVYDPDTAYNLPLTPARALQEWKEYIAAGIVRSASKVVSFNSGTVNYEMTSQKVGEFAPLPENGDVDLSLVEPIFDALIYKFKHPLSRDEMKLISANPYGYIEFEDHSGNVMQGFILDVQHDANKGTGEFELLKVYRPQ